MAKKINIRKPHGMDAADAQSRLDKLTAELETRFGVKVSKKGTSTAVKGKGVSGSASIQGADIVIDMKLGLPASLVAQRIEDGVNKSIVEHFQS